MEITIPFYAATLRNAFKKPQGERRSDTTSRQPIVPRRSAGLFRRRAPTTYQRCLAVHMHFAQHPSALD